MNLSELVEAVVKVVQDDDFDEEYIVKLLNRGMLRIAGGMKRPDSFTLTQPLPDLYTVATIATVTTTNHVALPVNYQRALVLACNSTGSEIGIHDSFHEFSKIYPLGSYPGAVYNIGVKGRSLYYYGVPSVAETITIHYHRYPEEMSSDNDEPDGLPPEFHHSLLVNFSCAEIERLKEDGIDGNEFNTKRYSDLFQLGLLELDASLPADGMVFTTSQSTH